MSYVSNCSSGCYARPQYPQNHCQPYYPQPYPSYQYQSYGGTVDRYGNSFAMNGPGSLYTGPGNQNVYATGRGPQHINTDGQNDYVEASGGGQKQVNMGGGNDAVRISPTQGGYFVVDGSSGKDSLRMYGRIQEWMGKQQHDGSFYFYNPLTKSTVIARNFEDIRFDNQPQPNGGGYSHY